MPSTKIEVACAYCGSMFTRPAAEYNRAIRLGRRSFCSRQCTGKASKNNIKDSQRVWAHLDSGNRRDEYTPFRYIYRVARTRSTEFGKEFTITLEDLAKLWKTQEGRCPYTGWLLRLPEGTSSTLLPDNASLDRINSSHGYVPGNIQFVSVMANYAKNRFTHEQMLEFCDAVAAKRAQDKNSINKDEH